MTHPADPPFTISPRDNVACISCGQVVGSQAPYVTQLNADFFVPKSHPRIRLRGQLDSLHALVGMAEHSAAAQQEPWLQGELAKVAAYCRELISAEYNERPVERLILDDLDAAELHAATHDPRSLGTTHLLLNGESAELLHWLNLIRTKSREVELVAYEAFAPDARIYGTSFQDFGTSIINALNLVASGVYYLALRFQASGG
ncbi:hypothetical protein ACIBD9_22270 [Micromonospora sp. NPDC050784]|uniref:hypothetical protein n=1 Tax=Micromonospora sp. NPDC050784 TaxID=3364281 RepID=UPI00379D963B